MSLFPKNISSKRLLKQREQDYLQAIRQLKRLLVNKNWQIIFCENTIEDIKNLRKSKLWVELIDQEVLISDSNIGEINKGIGELQMMTHVVESYPDLISNVQTVSYFTGRRIMTNLYLIDKTQNMTSSALISNPDFLQIDGTFLTSEKLLMYNDMFFSMKPQTFFQYYEYVKSLLSKLAVSNSKGSEQLLYDFINENNIDFEFLPCLGLLRREIRIKRFKSIATWQLC
jgi:hypothetical protein